jgi:hypothetical protein
MRRFILSFTVITLVSFYSLALGQEKASQVEAQPKTNIEKFIAQKGEVIIKSYTELGSISGDFGSNVSVDAKEFLNASSGRKTFGISIEVKEGGKYEKSNTSYIDDDEIDSLIKGIDYVSKIDKTITKLDNFEAQYITRGECKIIVYSLKSGISAAIDSGTLGRATCFLSLEQLQKFKDLVVAAKTKINSVK